MEKFFNIKCRNSGLVPDVAVIVATIRALKMHGGYVLPPSLPPFLPPSLSLSCPCPAPISPLEISPFSLPPSRLASLPRGPAVAGGKPLDPVYKTENVELVTKGCENLVHHIKNAAKYGVRCIVAINKFVTDTPAEVEAVKVRALHCSFPTSLPSFLSHAQT